MNLLSCLAWLVVGWLCAAYDLSDVERYDTTYVSASGGGVYLVTTVDVVEGGVACFGRGFAVLVFMSC